MKIELIEELVKKVADITIIKALLKNYLNEETEQVLYIIKANDYNFKLINILINRKVIKNYSVEERIKLVNKFRDCKYDGIVYNLITTSNIINLFNVDDVIKLINFITKKDCSNYVYSIIANDDVLKNRNVDEIIELLKLMNEISDDIESKKIYSMITSPSILGYRTFKEQIRLIKKLQQNYFEMNEYDFVLKEDIQKNRTATAQIQMIHVLRTSEKDDSMYEIMTDEDILTQRSFKEHILLMNLFKKVCDDGYDEEDVEDLIKHSALLSYRTCDEQIKLINEIVKTDFNNHAIDIVTSYNVQRKFSCDEIISLIQIFMSYTCTVISSAKLVKIICDPTILVCRTIDEQIRLIYLLNELTDMAAIDLIFENDLLNNRKNDEHIKLIDLYVKSNFDKNIYKLILDETMLKLSAEEQISAIEKLIGIKKDKVEIKEEDFKEKQDENYNTFMSQLDCIYSSDKLMDYLSRIKEEKSDIKTDTYVPILKRY